ncbi:MAG: LysM peptidoglycan-binding domain-containing protein [Bacteroidota bacterium]
MPALVLSLLYLTIIPAWGQTYSPDTSLTYSTFLKQCQTFPNSPKQEIWVVNFWASWDGASLYTLPVLKDIYAEYQYKPVRFISISVDKNRTDWQNRLMEYELPWEQMLITSQADYLFLQRAFIHNSELPAIFLVNTQGIALPMADIGHLRAELQQLSSPLPNQPYQPSSQLEVVTRPTDEIGSGGSASPGTADSSPAPVSDSPWITHTVRKGNTLFSISREYDVPVAMIRSNNSLSGNNIKVGQVLKIKQR